MSLKKAGDAVAALLVVSRSSRVRGKMATRSLQSLSAASIRFERNSSPAQKPTSFEHVGFGTVFTDHMMSIEYDSTHGWHTPLIHPFRHLSLHPGVSALHYSIQLFEGTKAYRSSRSGRTVMFRPDKNMQRLNSSAARVALPQVDGEELLKCMAQLIKVDEGWVPDCRTASLYVRPTYIGTEPTICVGPPNHALLYVLLSPVGPYFKTGTFKPVTLMADPAYVRSWFGGTGHYKLGGNYGPTIPIQKVAEERGCQQVMWLFGDDHKVTEVGTMNVFVHWINESGVEELCTPPLNNLILPGVTRDSVYTLAKSWGDVRVCEREITMGQLVKALEEDRLLEMFGAGTACVVCPIGHIQYYRDPDTLMELDIPWSDSNSLAKRVYDDITAIQYDEVDSPWTVDVDSLLGQSTPISQQL